MEGSDRGSQREQKATQPSTAPLVLTRMNNPRSLYAKFTEMSQTAAGSATEEGKGGGAMGKQEISHLREQVLRSVRPTNPWFETQKPFMSPTPSPSQSSSCESERIHSSRPYTAKKQPPPMPAKPVRSVGDSYAEEILSTRRLAEDLQILRELESESAQRRVRINHHPSITTSTTGLLPSIGLKEIESTAHSRTDAESLPVSPSSSNSMASSTSSSNGSSTRAPRTKNMDLGVDGGAFAEMGSNKRDRVHCVACGGELGGMVLNAFDQPYHPACFRCYRCCRCLDGVPFTVDNDGNVYCMEDYERLFVPACAKCLLPIAATNVIKSPWFHHSQPCLGNFRRPAKS